MTVEIPGLRPRVLSSASAIAIDEYLRFRHVVRHNYAFQVESERVESLATKLRPTFHDVSKEMEAFAVFVDRLARDA